MAQPRACCLAGLWSRAVDEAGGNPEGGGDVCLVPDVVEGPERAGCETARSGARLLQVACAGQQRPAGAAAPRGQAVRFTGLCSLLLS